jgi:hypothetical protein
MRRALSLTIGIVLAAALSSVRADVFELKDGGQIVGSIAKRIDGGGYVVRTADGAQVTIERLQLARIVEQDATYVAYQRRSRAAADTAEAHRELAAWCREHQLAAEADHHLLRVVELDPDDEDARRSLGYQRVGKRWLTREQVMQERGMVFFEGKWRTPQDVAIRQLNTAVGGAEADWHGKLRTWRGWLDNRRADRVADAQAAIANITDPNAAPALVKLLDNEEDPWIFDLLLATLGRLDSPVAVRTLVAYSLTDDDANVREQCLAYLMGGGRPVSLVPYVEALASKDNVIVNRAGTALGRIGDAEAISPLIDALETTHVYETGGGSGINAGFSPSGGGAGLSMGGNTPRLERQTKQNLGVLRALTKLSGGQNFEYDEQAWRRWYVDLQTRQRYNARRDE